MNNTSSGRSNVAGLLVILALSAMTMLWFFWHHPVKTSLVTLAILAVLGISAGMARPVDTEVESELTDGQTGV